MRDSGWTRRACRSCSTSAESSSSPASSCSSPSRSSPRTTTGGRSTRSGRPSPRPPSTRSSTAARNTSARSPRSDRGAGGKAEGKPKGKLLLVDGHALLFRAFFAIPVLRTSRGEATNAVLGFLRALLALVRDERPDLFGVAFDHAEATFREKAYAAYKANRPDAPDDLVAQIPVAIEVVRACGIPVFSAAGFEADDLLATLARRGVEAGWTVEIFSSDKDLCQVVSDRVTVLAPARDLGSHRRLDAAGVVERLGVPPEKVRDYLALAGDASDNVPGVRGIGPKTAVALLADHDGVDDLLRRLDALPPKIREKIEASREALAVSRDLVALRTDAPVDWDEAALRLRPWGTPEAAAILARLEMRSLAAAIGVGGGQATGPASGAATAPPTTAPRDETRSRRYRTVLDEKALRDLVAALRKEKTIAVDVETTSTKPTEADLVGLSFGAADGRCWYVPVGHRYEGAPAQVPLDRALDALRPVLEADAPGKVGHNLKYDAVVLRRHGVRLGGIAFDTMLASYLADPIRREHNLDALSLDRLGLQKITFETVAAAPEASGAAEGEGGGRRRLRTLDAVEISRVAEYACEDAEAARRLMPLLEADLDARGMADLFRKIEMPLLEILVGMEDAGVLVDSEALAALGAELGREIEGLRRRISEASGSDFNPASTKQLQEILFDRLGLPAGRRTKTGRSTDTEVLEGLAHLHAVPGLILEFRRVGKLKSTYVDALPALVNPRTGRVHTSFNQAVTATGRLSSSDPNLQNIPVRTDRGREIRRAFVAPRGARLVVADYSQIELRLLAHLSGDPGLLEAFRTGADVHVETAALVFGRRAAEVTPEERRRAKAVNYGLAYGQTAFGLARTLRIPQREAQVFIDSYFARFGGVRAWIDRTLEEARTKGYVETLWGRRRPVPEIGDRNPVRRQEAERIAINTPIQGTSADLMKAAMIRVDRRLRGEAEGARLVLQVHDELVVEAPTKRVKPVAAILREEMEGVRRFDVPIVADVGSGANWLDAKPVE